MVMLKQKSESYIKFWASYWKDIHPFSYAGCQFYAALSFEGNWHLQGCVESLSIRVHGWVTRGESINQLGVGRGSCRPDGHAWVHVRSRETEEGDLRQGGGKWGKFPGSARWVEDNVFSCGKWILQLRKRTRVCFQNPIAGCKSRTNIRLIFCLCSLGFFYYENIRVTSEILNMFCILLFFLFLLLRMFTQLFGILHESQLVKHD